MIGWEVKVRDSDNHIRLEQLGWHVIVVWECQLKKHNLHQTLKQLCIQIKGVSYECNK